MHSEQVDRDPVNRNGGSHISRPKALLTAAEAAREVFNVSERTFHNWRDEKWMPRPVTLGPRILRWVRSELEAAAAQMPRLLAPQAEPIQLKRGRSSGRSDSGKSGCGQAQGVVR